MAKATEAERHKGLTDFQAMKRIDNLLTALEPADQRAALAWLWAKWGPGAAAADAPARPANGCRHPGYGPPDLEV